MQIYLRFLEEKLTFVGSAVVGDVVGSLEGRWVGLGVVGCDVVGDAVGFFEGGGVGGTDGGFGAKAGALISS